MWLDPRIRFMVFGFNLLLVIFVFITLQLLIVVLFGTRDCFRNLFLFCFDIDKGLESGFKSKDPKKSESIVSVVAPRKVGS